MRFPQPTPPTLRARHDPLGVEPFGRISAPRSVSSPARSSCLLARELAREPLPPAGLGLKLWRELVTARIAMLLVLGLDRSRSPRAMISRAIRS